MGRLEKQVNIYFYVLLILSAIYYGSIDYSTNQKSHLYTVNYSSIKTQNLLLYNVVSYILSYFVLDFHVSAPTHPKFSFTLTRKLILAVHILSGYIEMFCLVMGYSSSDPYVWSQTSVITALLFHIPTSIYHWPGVYGVKKLVIPCYFVSIFAHLVSTYGLYKNPFDPICLLKMSASLNIYVWVRVSFTVFKYLHILEGNEYSASILCAGMITMPLVFDSLGCFILPISILFYNYLLSPLWDCVKKYVSYLCQSSFFEIDARSKYKEHVRTVKFSFHRGKCSIDAYDDTNTFATSINNESSMKNKSDNITINEWKNKILKCSTDNSALTSFNMAKIIFDLFDSSGNGVIETHVLKDMLIGFGLSEYDLKECTALFPSNGLSLFCSHSNSEKYPLHIEQNRNRKIVKSSGDNSNSINNSNRPSTCELKMLHQTNQLAGNAVDHNINRFQPTTTATASNSTTVTAINNVSFIELSKSSVRKSVVEVEQTTSLVTLEIFIKEWKFLWEHTFHALRTQLQKS